MFLYCTLSMYITRSAMAPHKDTNTCLTSNFILHKYSSHHTIVLVRSERIARSRAPPKCGRLTSGRKGILLALLPSITYNITPSFRRDKFVRSLGTKKGKRERKTFSHLTDLVNLSYLALICLTHLADLVSLTHLAFLRLTHLADILLTHLALI